MPRYTLIKNAQFVLPNKKSKYASMLFKNKDAEGESRVIEISENPKLPENAAENLTVINMRGKYICPSFTDLCVIPGRKNASEISAAAAMNGYSSVLVHPTTNSELDASFGRSECKTENGIRMYRALSVGTRAGDAAAFSDNSGAAKSLDELKDRMLAAHDCNKTFFVNLSDNYFPDAVCSDKAISSIISVKPFLQSYRDASLYTVLSLANELKARVHVLNVSRSTEIEIIKNFKYKGANLSAGSSFAYFSMSERDLVFYRNSAKINPPLASPSDVKAVAGAFADRTLDCISSYHKPCSDNEKSGSIAQSMWGYSGFESAFGASYTNLVLSGFIGKERLIELLCEAPSQILGENKSLEPGQRADFNVINFDKEYVLLKNMLYDPTQGTPLLGMSFYGRVEQSFIDGKKI